jgi:hypothetical protein
MEFESLAKFEADLQKVFNEPAWRGFYSKVTPLVQSGYREILNVVDVANADRVTVAASGAAVA